MGAVNAASSRRLRRHWRAGALALLLAMTVLPFGAPATQAASTDLATNCGVSLRTEASTASPALTILPTGSVVTWTETVPGSSWSATCGSLVTGSSWYAITAVNGQSVSSLYGAPVAYAATGLFRPADGTEFLEGVDVSRWQGPIDFVAVRSAGKRFVIAKATEGIGFLDPAYQTNKAGAGAAGLAVTAYHFARPDLNPANPQGEADWFVDSLGLVPGMLVPALDLEVAGTLGTAELQAWVQGWLDRVYARTGVRAMIYASPSFWKKYLADTTAFADQGYSILWVAHWFVAGPTVPARNWSNRGWTYWQYSNCGSVPGISGCVDLDRYNGSDLTPVTYGADFAVSASPASASVVAGAATALTLNFARTFVTTPIQVTVTGLPAGSTAALSASPVTGSSTTLTVATTRSGTPTPVGSFPLTITATSGALTRTTSFTLTVVDASAPVVRAPVYRLVYPARLSGSLPVRIEWSAADPDGISAYGVQRQTAGGSWQDVALPSTTSTSLTQSMSVGTPYRYAARAADGAGNLSDWTPGSTASVLVAEQTSASIAYSGTWRTATSRYASGGSLKYATRYGASATYTFTGSGVAWLAYRGPNRGSARVYVDGVYRKTVNLYSSSYVSRQVVFAYNWASSGAHKIKVVALGTAGHPRVDVDAFLRLTIQ
ncbi:MAG: glycoside hydrolase family 25 protein [Chloroflexota bacterium]